MNALRMSRSVEQAAMHARRSPSGFACNRRSQESVPETSAAHAFVMVLAVLMAIAGVSKALDPHPALEPIEALAPDVASAAILVVLLMVEFVLASWLASGKAARAAIWAFCAFIAFVSIAVLYLLLSGAKVGCGCGLPMLRLGTEAELWIALVRNLLLVVLGAASLRMLSASSGSERRN